MARHLVVLERKGQWHRIYSKGVTLPLRSRRWSRSLRIGRAWCAGWPKVLVERWKDSGWHDFVGIAQFPDAEMAAGFALAVATGGGVHNFKTTSLLTWSEGLNALKKAAGVKYRPPTKLAK
jgi:hypothetical protein